MQASNSLQAAVSALVDSEAVNKVKAQVPDRLQNRLFRKPSRSSSRHGELERTKWHIELNQHCNGGLRNAVNSLSDRLRRKLWVGVLGTPTDKLGNDLRDDVDFKMRKEAQCLPVWIPDAEFSKCYDEFCHRVSFVMLSFCDLFLMPISSKVLWPLLHYTIPDAPRTKSFYETESWSHYIAVNQKFADAIVENYEEGDICACLSIPQQLLEISIKLSSVWINDYHLMLLPSMIRARLPNAPIGFFMHVAFPSSEIFRCLPMREMLLRGMLGADLIGFQTASYARHFRQTVSRILTLEALPKGIQTVDRFVDVAVFPMGIDVASLSIKR